MSDPNTGGLAGVLSVVARSLEAEGNLEDTLRAVVRSAVDTVPGAARGGVSFVAQAQGIVMSQSPAHSRAGVALLVAASPRSNTKLVEVAGQIVMAVEQRAGRVTGKVDLAAVIPSIGRNCSRPPPRSRDLTGYAPCEGPSRPRLPAVSTSLT